MIIHGEFEGGSNEFTLSHVIDSPFTTVVVVNGFVGYPSGGNIRHEVSKKKSHKKNVYYMTVSLQKLIIGLKN